MELQSQDKDGQTFIVKVTKIEDETITVDANHPLAGGNTTLFGDNREYQESRRC